MKIVGLLLLLSSFSLYSMGFKEIPLFTDPNLRTQIPLPQLSQQSETTATSLSGEVHVTTDCVPEVNQATHLTITQGEWPLTTEYISHIARTLPNLTHLTVSNLNISHKTSLDILEALANNFPHLVYLDISHNDIGSHGLMLLSKAIFAPNLTHLNLESNGIKLIGSARIPSGETRSGLYGGEQYKLERMPLENFTNLKELNLNNNPFGDMGLSNLVTNDWIANLTSLGLRNTNIGDYNIWKNFIRDTKPFYLQLIHYTRFRSLKNLDISNNPALSNNGFFAIADSTLAPQLVSLNMAGIGLISLAFDSFDKFTNLQSLHAENNPIDRDAVEDVIRNLKAARRKALAALVEKAFFKLITLS